MLIKIGSTNVHQETTSKGSVLIKQQAAMDVGRDFPISFYLVVKEAYPPGDYTISSSSFKVNQFGSLELDSYGLKLVKVK